jgi:hypothetical protein
MMQPFDAFGGGRGPVGHMPAIIPQAGEGHAAKEKGGSPCGLPPVGYVGLMKFPSSSM